MPAGRLGVCLFVEFLPEAKRCMGGWQVSVTSTSLTELTGTEIHLPVSPRAAHVGGVNARDGQKRQSAAEWSPRPWQPWLVKRVPSELADPEA